MAGKAEEDDDEDEEEALAVVRWRVTDGSEEAEVHPATNVLNPDRFRVWQTQRPCDEAWLVLEPRPPSAFSRVDIVNAGSALVELLGLRDDDNAQGEYELLLSPQQVMTVKDLTGKANRNRALTYDTDANHKLSPVAAQQRWRKLRINCRQPFGTTEHRACIGLAYINFTPCKPRRAYSQLPERENGFNNNGAAKRKVLPPEDLGHQNEKKKPKQSLEPQKVNVVKPEPQDYALSPHIPGVHGSVSETKIRKLSSDGKEFVEKVIKPRLVIGMGAIITTDPAQYQAFRLASSPFPRKDGSVSKMKSRKHSPDRNSKPKIEDVKEEVVVVGLQATNKWSDNVQSGKTQNVDIGVNAAQEVGKSQHVHNANKRCGTTAAQAPPHTQSFNSAQELGKAGGATLESGPTGSTSMKSTTGIEDFAKVLEGVVFAISGIQNPARGLFRTQGLEMGAQYRPDWTSDCTVLVCAFKDTPKFKQVKADGGTIVSKEWISECHQQRKLVSIERFLMHKGRPWRKPVYKVNCGSLEEVQEWVYDDLASTCNWLQQRDPKPKPEELEFTAAQGIMVCFEDTIKCIQANQGVSSIVESWGCLPRAIKELAAMEEGREGYIKKKGKRSHMLGEAARLKHVYTDILNPIFVACSKRPPESAMKKEKR